MTLGRIEGANAVHRALRIACQRAGTVKAFAAAHGLSHSTLGQMLRGEYAISAQVAKLVGFERLTLYRPLERKK